ncbi:MAG: universal stress protein [Actinomycetota bacterium]
MKVLVTTDGEPHSEHGIVVFAAVADRGAEVEVVSINSFDVSLKIAAGSGPGAHYDPEAGRQRCQAAVDGAVTTLAATGFSATGRVAEGDPATEIMQIATDGAFDLIVMGAGSERWLDAVMLGSTSTSVLHHAPCSVLIAHTAVRAAGDRHHVLVATDGSDQAVLAAQRLADLADPARCDVRVVAVDQDGQHPAAAAAAIGVVAKVLEDAALTMSSAVLSGRPARTLLQEAKDHTLVVVGATGEGGRARVALGSVSDKLAGHAPATLVGR